MSAYRKPTPWTRPPITTCRRSAVEALFPDERHEAAGNGTHECRSVVPANDELEQLVVSAADRHDQPAFRLQLLVESARRLRSRRSDGDRSEGGVFGIAERSVADVHGDAIRVPRGRKVRPRQLGELGETLDRVHFRGELGQHGGLVPRAGADIEHAPVADSATGELLLDHSAALVDHVTPETTLASITPFTSVVFAGGTTPMPSIGTSESPRDSEPWLPPPA